MTFTYPSHTTKGCVPLSSDVKELYDMTVSVIQKLNRMTDAEFSALDLAPDMMKKDW